MAASAQSVKTHCITLNASAQLVCEYMDYATSSILFQRGILPHRQFRMTTFYGSGQFFKLTGWKQSWIEGILWEIEDFIIRKELINFTIVIYNTSTLESLERWEFVVDDVQGENGGTAQQGKSLKRIHFEIREVMRQISATVSFLPFRNYPCDFKFVVTCVPGTIFPRGWTPCGVTQGNFQEVILKSFGTGNHNVNTCVYYKDEDM